MNVVYLVTSCGANALRYFYCGHTYQPEVRLAQHNGATKFGGRRSLSLRRGGGQWMWAARIPFPNARLAQLFEMRWKKARQRRSYPPARGGALRCWVHALVDTKTSWNESFDNTSKSNITFEVERANMTLLVDVGRAYAVVEEGSSWSLFDSH